jgi:HSP20 family protein
MSAVTLYRPRIFDPRVLENALSGFDRYMESFFGDNLLAPSERIFNRLPSVDVHESDKAYILEAELPGYEEKDIDIHLDGNNLTIESKKEEVKKEEAGADRKYLIQERRASSFCRTFKLPENADREGVAASFKNGILSLEIKKRAEAQKKVIQISKN